MKTIARSFAVLALGLSAFAAACITVNIYFPAPEVRAAAEEIVEETWGNGTADAVPDSPQSLHRLEQALRFAATVIGPVVAPREAHAADPDINVSTAAIRKLKDAMRMRAEALKPYLNNGRLGVGKDGMLVTRELTGMPLKDQADVRRLLDAENRDRKQLYTEIAEANDFGADRVGEIAKIFAETWVAKAEAGWWIQQPDGNWKRR